MDEIKTMDELRAQAEDKKRRAISEQHRRIVAQRAARATHELIQGAMMMDDPSKGVDILEALESMARALLLAVDKCGGGPL